MFPHVKTKLFKNFKWNPSHHQHPSASKSPSVYDFIFFNFFCGKHIIQSCFYSHSNNFYILVGVLKPFTFNVNFCIVSLNAFSFHLFFIPYISSFCLISFYLFSFRLGCFMISVYLHCGLLFIPLKNIVVSLWFEIRIFNL